MRRFCEYHGRRDPANLGPEEVSAAHHMTEAILLALRGLCALIVLFVAGAGFLFGQLFAGQFSLGGTLAGSSGILVALFAWFPGVSAVRKFVTLTTAVAMVGAALHVYEYYSTDQVSGNYYAWFLTGPFIVSLGILGLAVPCDAIQANEWCQRVAGRLTVPALTKHLVVIPL